MNTIQKIAPMAVAAAVLFGPAVALAQAGVYVAADASTSVSAGGAHVGASANIDARITRAKSHADQEIKRRVDILDAIGAKVQAMMKLSADEKSGIASAISTEVSDLTALQAKIDADTDLTALKTDIKSIATSYRVFVLVIPRARIDVAADRIQAVAGMLSTFAAKLQARISQASGDTSALASQLADMNAKIADAQAQANAAVSAAASLQIDNGDKNLQASNAASLKDARSKIQAALQDLKTARKDAGAIVKALKGMNANAHASASTSVSTH